MKNKLNEHKINKNIFTFFLHIFIFLSIATTISAQEEGTTKPRVAIKAPLVNDSISSQTQKSLDLTKLLAEMEAALLSARKFDIVSRQEGVMQDIRDEQQFASSALSAGDGAAEGKMQAANFLLIPTVTGFSFGTTTSKIPNLTSKYMRNDHGQLEVSAQVVDTETGQIKATFSMKSSFSTSDSIVDQAGGKPGAGQFTTMAQKVSEQMVDQLLDLVFPVEIINIKGNQIFINRGQDGGFKTNMILNVYQKGDELKDPHTGEILGSGEELVGKIKVVRINPKFTVAEATGKDGVSKMAVGNIIRKP
ncbi:MAG: CsgG/HfaB family protein [Desulfocapsaceae bacterium]|nr:CsgG/HfaB family protein [Desulfocapsaceae bacterium]